MEKPFPTIDGRNLSQFWVFATRESVIKGQKQRRRFLHRSGF